MIHLLFGQFHDIVSNYHACMAQPNDLLGPTRGTPLVPNDPLLGLSLTISPTNYSFHIVYYVYISNFFDN